MSMPKNSKIHQFLNYRMRVAIADTRTLVGKFLAFDRHMNIVLADCDEFRRIPVKGKKGTEREEKRALGLVVVRGETVVSMTVEGPPPAEESRVRAVERAKAGPGVATAAGRGVTISAPGQPAPGLAGAPMRGVGGPAAGMMAPQQSSAAPVSYQPMQPPGHGVIPTPPGMPMGGRGMPPPGMGMPPPGMPGVMPPMGGRGMPPMGYGAPPPPPPMGMGRGMPPPRQQRATPHCM